MISMFLNSIYFKIKSRIIFVVIVSFWNQKQLIVWCLADFISVHTQNIVSQQTKLTHKIVQNEKLHLQKKKKLHLFLWNTLIANSWSLHLKFVFYVVFLELFWQNNNRAHQRRLWIHFCIIIFIVNFDMNDVQRRPPINYILKSLSN